MTLHEELKSYDLFKASSDDFIAALATIAQKEKSSQGTAILTEGQLNERLLILSSGQVEVKVNGERVAQLTIPGDLMGEISVLAGRPATASLTAITDVEYFAIPARALDRTIEFGFELYRLFAAVLSDKIIKTNEKARQFEIAHRSLVDINRTLDQKVQERTEATFKRLSELQNALGQKDTELALEILKPINEMFSTERSIRSRRVLVAEPDRKQQTIARMALGGTGARLEMATNAEEVIAALEASSTTNSSPDLIFVSSSLSELLPEIKKHAPRAKIVYMAGNELITSIDSLKTSAPLLSNIVSRHSEDRNFTVKNMATTVTKLVSKDLFGLEKYMMWGVEAQSRPVTCSSERAQLIENMQEHLQSLGVRSKITERAASVAEELLMNAIYDAPVANGHHHYAHLPRTTAVDLKPAEHGELRFACDGMLAAVSVSDPFGAFRMDTLLDYLEKNANSKGESIQVSGKGGAGRGLHHIINSSDLVVFNVRANAKTEVIAFFNLDPGAKDESPRQFHFFSE